MCFQHSYFSLLKQLFYIGKILDTFCLFINPLQREECYPHQLTKMSCKSPRFFKYVALKPSLIKSAICPNLREQIWTRPVSFLRWMHYPIGRLHDTVWKCSCFYLSLFSWLLSVTFELFPVQVSLSKRFPHHVFGEDKGGRMKLANMGKSPH